MDKTNRSLRTMAVGGGVLLLALAAYGVYTAQQQLGGTSSPAVTSSPTPAMALAPGARYVFKDKLDYGYEMARTDEQLKAGQAASTVHMIRFLGKEGGAYQIAMGTGTERVVYEGSPPFDFVKGFVVAGDKVIDEQVMRLDRSAIARVALEDAHNGHLQQYAGGRDGVQGHLWLDTQRRRLTFKPL